MTTITIPAAVAADVHVALARQFWETASVAEMLSRRIPTELGGDDPREVAHREGLLAQAKSTMADLLAVVAAIEESPRHRDDIEASVDLAIDRRRQQRLALEASFRAARASGNHDRALLAELRCVMGTAPLGDDDAGGEIEALSDMDTNAYGRYLARHDLQSTAPEPDEA